MSKKTAKRSRRGAALVLVAICLIPLIACLALAIDLGMLVAARGQVQAASDAAAMAGTRALNGITANNANNNYSNVLPNARTAATNNSVLGQAITNSEVSVNIGRYTYDSADQRFEGQFPGPSGENYSLVQATVSVPISTRLAFSKIFNFSAPNIQATAAAAHRPRDVAIILDYSGSMRFGSLLGTPYSGDRNSNNQDTLVPAFGHYSSSSAGLVAGSASPPYDDCNISFTTSDGRLPIVRDFYTDANGTVAFSTASSGYATTPGGDNYLKTNKNAGSSYGQTAASILNISSPGNGTIDSSWESNGYTAYSMRTQFYGYTTGPGYWGKSFFIWPPSPNTTGGPSGTNDWRERYFYEYGTTTPCDDNSRLWDSSGNWKAPGSGNYSINYTAVLNFIKNIGPNPFPSRLQSGRIVYYTAIPDSISTSSWPPSDLNQRFWKDYIDYCLGVMQTGSSSWSVISDGSTGYTGYGPDFNWGTIRITPKSSLTGSPKPYMHYGDNPKRPNLKFWFGPLSMVDCLGCYNLWSRVNPDCSRFCWWPGTCHESPMYACKLGIRAALTDIQTNHPNDWVSMIMFSIPQTSSTDDGARFNRVRVGLGRDYTSMLDSLWYPPSTIGNSSATVTPYASDNIEVPRACGGTCYPMALMLAYNQFSANSSLKTYNPGKPSGDAGGNGRKGAQKLVIFETDGAPNTNASATFSNNGAYNSYYNIRYNSSNPGSSEFPTNVDGYSDNASTVTSQINAVCTRICALDTASSPGYSTASRPVKIHCIGFGPAFDPSSGSAAANKATLNAMQVIGGVNDGMPSYKIIYGTESQVITKLQTAFQKIMTDGIQVTLIQ